MRWLAVLFVLASPLAAETSSVSCENVEHLGASFTTCEVRPAEHDLRLFLRDDQGDILGGFSAVEKHEGLPLLFAMNAGMYHEDRAPVGLYIEDGVEEMRLVSSAGPGNFGLLPNAVLCINDNRADIVESLAYKRSPPNCRDATQSGPMLLIGNELHPRLLPNGTSRHIRNGVGADPDGARLIFAISNEPVNFHDFATLFRDRLGTPNALYFDGNISRLYAPDLNRSDFGWQLGPIVGVLDDKPVAD